MVYLDHAATTPVHQDVLKKMYEVEASYFGNPSSIHQFGRQSKHYLEDARRYLAQTIGAKDREIIFTSGGTEANNMAIIGTAFENERNGNHIITSQQEHHAILHIMEYLQKKGFHVTYLPVDKHGRVDPNDVKRTLTDQTILVSVMYANNETGVIQPVDEIAALLQDHQAYFHTDAVQAYSMLDIDVHAQGIDLLTTSGHKLNAPKGIGFLYANETVPFQKLTFGGSQERERRPGTENLIGAVGFHEAAKIAMNHKQENYKKYLNFKEAFLKVLEAEEVEFAINGDMSKQIPTILNLSFPGIKIDVMLTSLDLLGIAASSGSACTAGSIEPSHVLKSMYSFRSKRPENSIRFSFGSENNLENIKEAAHKVAEVVKRITN